ncbi:phosphoadenylyl-sulfate reductase [Verrucomicrobiota bacterium]
MKTIFGKEGVGALQAELEGKSPVEVLRWAAANLESPLFASSLGQEDQVITDLIARYEIALPIITLDTGRLFPETYDLLAETEKRYGLKVRVLFPDATEVEEMVDEHGVNLFRESIENRKLCCGVRKIHPLRRALAEADGWVCGLRRDQGTTRTNLQVVEWDEGNGIVKLNPLYDWSLEQVQDYIRENDVPYNPLHDKGFISIGCASCTRAVQPGEDIRAGRWWWERPEQKECGLHFVNGKFVRTKDLEGNSHE